MSEERTDGGGEAAELLVVGAGIIGLSCAWRAARAGIETIVIDAGPRERASAVAAGMLAPIGEASWGEEALHEAATASATAWPAFAAELAAASGLEIPYRRCGALHVALDRDEAAELRRVHELHERFGLESRWLRGSECRRLEPGLSPLAVGGLEAPGEAEVDPRDVLAALRAALRAEGVAIRDGAEAVELLIDGDRTRGARLADGRSISADTVLVASGARAGGDLLPPEVRPPVRPVRGEIVRLRAAPGTRPCERLIVTERVYVVPRAGEEVVLGATVEDRGFDLRVIAGGVLELLREAYRVLPEIAELELVDCQAGLRPATPDNVPVVGATAIEGLLLAAGHHRNGILLAPLSAAIIEALLTGAPEPPEARRVRPARFERAPAGVGS